MSATEYRELAAECASWAKTAKSEKERMIFEMMSAAWLQAAALSEGQQAPPGPILLDNFLQAPDARSP